MLDAQDPAFGAVKLWVDTNQNALVDAGEQFDLGQLQLSSIDFISGHIRYSNGQAQALHTTALESDTDGAKYSKIVIQEEGKDLDAGFTTQHEGYQGQVLVVPICTHRKHRHKNDTCTNLTQKLRTAAL